MKKVLKILSLILSLVMIISFSGCASSEAKNVMSLIDNIGEISVDSKTKIDIALEAYNALNEKDKKDVKNIDDLYEAQEAFEQYIPEYISSKVSDYRFSNSINYDELKQFVLDYYDYLDDDQIEIIGCAIGKCKLKDLVISKVKESMKNPNSFELVDFDPGYIMRGSDGTYSTLVNIKFRGTNSFGGVVSDSMSGTIDFNVNFDDCTISYVKSFFM